MLQFILISDLNFIYRAGSTNFSTKLEPISLALKFLSLSCPKMRSIVIASLKGGVGKTTLAIYLAASISKTNFGKKVLIIDADPNNNLTDFFLRDESLETLEEKNLFTVLLGDAKLEDSLRKFSGFSILPATPELAGAHLELSNDPGSMLRFQANLKKLGFDYVVWDTPPSLTYELFLALHGSDIVLCPIGFSRWTFQGFKLIERACQRLEAPSPICVPFNVSAKDQERIYDTKGINRITKTAIPRSAQFSKSATLGKLFSDSHDLWSDFEKLTKEIL